MKECTSQGGREKEGGLRMEGLNMVERVFGFDVAYISSLKSLSIKAS